MNLTDQSHRLKKRFFSDSLSPIKRTIFATLFFDFFKKNLIEVKTNAISNGYNKAISPKFKGNFTPETALH